MTEKNNIPSRIIKVTALFLALLLLLSNLALAAENLAGNSGSSAQETAEATAADAEEADGDSAPVWEPLTANEQTVYDCLKEQICEVAAGSRTETSLEVPVSLFGLKEEYSEKDLELSGQVFVYSQEEGRYAPDKEILGEARSRMNALLDADIDKLISTLRADCPYDMYWCANEVSWTMPELSVRGVINSEGQTAYFTFGEGSIRCDFSVAQEFAPDDGTQYAVDPEKTADAVLAAQKAQEIVQQAAALSDQEKLAFYKDTICALVSYNDEAAAAGTPEVFGSKAPWQPLDVFLAFGDETGTDRKVVCEGYTKAFQYLCDLTDFEDDGMHCLTVSGRMEGTEGTGPHTWNLLVTGDGRTFLVDVTNCDEGTVGAPDLLFLRGDGERGTCEGSVSKGYRLRLPEGAEVIYRYDGTTRQLYAEQELELKGFAYDREAEQNN